MQTTFTLWAEGNAVKTSINYEELYNLALQYKEEGRDKVIIEIVD